MSMLSMQFTEIRQDELDGLHKEIRRLRALIVQIGDVINCDDGGAEQVCLDTWKIIDAEIRLPNTPISGNPPLPGSDGLPSINGAEKLREVK